MEAENSISKRVEEAKNMFISLAMTTAFHPLCHARTLMQVGFEPLPPVEKRRFLFFGRKIQAYPSGIAYIKYMITNHGFFNLYGGLSYRLAQVVLNHKISTFMQHEAEKRLVPTHDAPPAEKWIRDVVTKSIVTVVTVTASQPLQVLAVRCMSEMVGNETVYSVNPFNSIYAVYNNDGWFGFFAGLAPHLVASLLGLWITSILDYILTSVLENMADSTMKKSERAQVKVIAKPLFDLIANTYSYPFSVVSTNMIVAGSGLTAGSEPFMLPHHKYPWYDCFFSLKRQGCLKRGATMIIRPVPKPQW